MVTRLKGHAIAPWCLCALACTVFGSGCDDEKAQGNDDTQNTDTSITGDTSTGSSADGTDTDTDSNIDPNLQVATPAGVVAGARENGVRVFRGIPYGAPPVGDLRFRPPVAAPPWDGVLEATEPAPYCVQVDLMTKEVTGDEDCLTLNVFAPDVEDGQALPVMVWLHGGAFIWGSASEPMYDGAALAAAQNAVVVTVNYRLGPLGFLAHPALTAENAARPSSGNYAVLDQRLALEWVRGAISDFGGDPERVTLFGQSAGAVSVGMHLVSPGSRGLFHRAIVMSGPVDLFPSPVLKDAEARGEAFAAKVGCESGADALGCLRKLPAADLVSAYEDAEQLPGGIFFQSAETDHRWGPIVDGEVIPVRPTDAIADGDVAQVPVMLGATLHEGPLFQSDIMSAVKLADEEDYTAALERSFGAHADAVAERYPLASFEGPNDAVGAVNGDAYFVCPTRRMARDLAENRVETYLYRFAYQADGMFSDLLGVFHASDIAFVFGVDNAMSAAGEAGRPLVEAMGGAWSAFARDGVPSLPEGTSTWPLYDMDTHQHVVFDLPLDVHTDFSDELCDFWDSLI